MSRTPRVTAVVSHLSPTLGLEGAALRVLQTLDEVYELQVVSLAGGLDDHQVWPGIHTAAPRQLRGWRRIGTLLRVRRMLRGDNCDVRLLIGAPAAAAVLCTGRARATDIVWEHSLNAERVRGSAALRLLWAMLRRRYARVGTIVAVSPPVADLVASTGAPTVLIPNIVPDLLAAPDAPDATDAAHRNDGLNSTLQSRKPHPDSPPELLCVGTLSTLKNQLLIVDALPLLPAGTRLTLLGDGPARAALEARVQALGLADQVTFVGHVPAAAVADAMLAADLLVHPARSETFGLVYVEAAQRRLPVVSLAHLAAKWLVPTYVPGALVAAAEGAPAPTPGDLAQLVRATLVAPPDEAAWARADAARARDLNPATIQRRWVDLVQEIVTHRDTAQH